MGYNKCERGVGKRVESVTYRQKRRTLVCGFEKCSQKHAVGHRKLVGRSDSSAVGSRVVRRQCGVLQSSQQMRKDVNRV